MLYHRFIKNNVLEALGESPVVLIVGARQTGNTTLVKGLVNDLFEARRADLLDPLLNSYLEIGIF